MSNSDNEFERRVKSALDSGYFEPGDATRRQLVLQRARAFERQPFFSRLFATPGWVPATAFAACAVFAVVLFLANAPRPAPEQLALQDSETALEVLFVDEEHEEIGDPDFYVWLDAMLLEDEDETDAS
ncbi:MAG: hypothetical protein HZB47_14610 [Nitrosomonadales bacterium]|nr:hypothetical protein [Nitrosomonadales bacterium]